MKKSLCLVSLVFLLITPAFADYAPAPAPLMTVWGEKMTPETAWALYPRPQMQREQWTNLNGLWDYAITKREEGFPK